MIIPIDKLLTYQGNKYIFTKATMKAVEKLGNIQGYPEGEEGWKVVPNILKLILEDKLKIDYTLKKGEIT
jgi:hypothetical protein